MFQFRFMAKTIYLHESISVPISSQWSAFGHIYNYRYVILCRGTVMGVWQNLMQNG